MARITETRAPRYTLEVDIGELLLIHRALWRDNEQHPVDDQDENADLYNAIDEFLEAQDENADLYNAIDEFLEAQGIPRHRRSN